MAFRDTWHRALVYFGLAEGHGYEEGEAYDEPSAAEEELFEPRATRRSNVRRLERRRPRDDIEDIFAEEEGGASASASTRVLRPVDNGGVDVQVHLVTPTSFNDAQEIADKFKRGVPVILNLQSTEGELSKRLIDFGSGLTYALEGGMQRIADKTFLLTPRNVEVSAEEKARLVERGFFNQS